MDSGTERGASALDALAAKKVVRLRVKHQPDDKNATAADPAPDDDRPEIVYVAGELPDVIDKAEAAIIAMPGQPRIYQRGGILARIVRRGPTSARRIKRADGGISIIAADVPHLVELLTEAAIWLRIDKRSDGYRAINCPHEVATVLLSRGQWKLPALTGVIEAPTLRPDGSVLEAHGYDAATGLYLDLGHYEI